jgi:hypothetical protein
VSPTLVGASAFALVLGLVFPVAAIVVNPFLAYGIVTVSWPAWTLGAVAGAVACVRQRAARAAGAPPRPWGWMLCAANVLAALATLAIPFHVS